MKHLFCAINAKFSHTGLAARLLSEQLKAAGYETSLLECTINQPAAEILAALVAEAPDRLYLSCYIWNIALVHRVGADFRKLFPDAQILLGGPEVSFLAPDALEQVFAWADAILCGEGEGILPRLAADPHPRGFYHAQGCVPMDTLPFPYPDLEALQARTLYYESTRGCPFGCAYCLSSADRQLRVRSLTPTLRDLQRFLDAQVRVVKFVDRTFNLDADRAEAIWSYLMAHDNGCTAFQMELGGDLLTERQLALLAQARPGLFQFEIGVQSTHSPTLREICRETDLAKLKQNVAALLQAGNIHLHLDLIAGLPHEDFATFTRSFDEVYAMRPMQLQLGFLKLLRGSTLWAQRERYGLICSDAPPYELLANPWIPFAALERLRGVERMVECYHNSGRFTHLLAALLKRIDSPFALFDQLAARMPTGRSVGKYDYYTLLWQQGCALGGDPDRLGWLMRYDLLLHERARRQPQGCPDGDRRRPESFGLPKHLWVEAFPFDPRTGTSGETLLAFDYERRDTNAHAHVRTL